jgi:hypothetical protein
MASRPLIVATLVGASVGVPYFTSQIQQGQKAGGAPVSVAAKPAAEVPAAPVPTLSTAGVPAYANGARRLDGAQFTSFTQVLRFDVTKEWVYQNWSRKTTAPTDVGLVSVRVPLVMGAQMSALAGSLTYFFNAQGQVEHISFRGSTGDTTQLVQWLTRNYQFQPVQSPTGEQVYQVQSGDGVQSELQIQPEPVMKSNAPHQSIAVQLEFAKPGSPRFLPQQAPALQIPQGASPVAEATPAAAEPASEGMTAAVKSAASGYWNQIHYATPEEQTPAMLRRWPD